MWRNHYRDVFTFAQGGTLALLQKEDDEGITRLERRLYFQTAHGHFKAGCPALALEVLSKLPARVRDERPKAAAEPSPEQSVHTGHLSDTAKSTTRSRQFVRRCAYLYCRFITLPT